MSSWRTEYLRALETRDGREKANYDLIASYTKLADRTAGLEHTALRPIASAPPSIPPAAATGAGDKGREATVPTETLLSRIKLDLSEAQRSKVELQARLTARTEESERLKGVSQLNAKRVQELSAERNTLHTRVRDRDEELREKAKLLENVQDEMISLNLQLNVAERQAEDLRTENRELVDRWMARMGKEADAMNDASEFS